MSKGPKDLNQTAFDLVARATGGSTSEKVTRAREGGKARKEALTTEQRSEIAKKAAERPAPGGEP